MVDPQDPWLSGLRAALRRVAVDQQRLIAGRNAAGSDFVRRLAQRLGIHCDLLPITYDPGASHSELPEEDLALLRTARTVYVLSVSTEGNIHRLLRDRLRGFDRLSEPQNIVLVNLPGLQSTTARDELCAIGANLWQPTIEECLAIPSSKNSAHDPLELGAYSSDSATIEIVPFPTVGDWEFLSHSTRRRPGPWPDESFESYCDSLLESRSEADHSTLGTLQRILIQRRLKASNRTIRDGYQVVSFTACPLLQLPTLHKFRRHRVRWDFEPYGLCIRKEWLKHRDTRPVIYGDESAWKKLAEPDQPFFQLQAGKSGIDWSQEQEWRHVGDLDLNQLSIENVMVFVPDFASAKSVARFTNWPITLWPVDDQSSHIKP